ncbi:MAG: peptidoglycan recognition family protein [Propionibacteriaceae bacterium]
MTTHSNSSVHHDPSAGPHTIRPNTIRRRTLLGAALGAGAALAVGPVAIAGAVPTSRRAVPTTLAATGRPGTIQSPGFRVGHLGVSWTGGEHGGSVRFRYADGWHAPRPLMANDSADGRRRRALIYAGPATAYEVLPALDSSSVNVQAINTVDGPPSSARLAAATDPSPHHPNTKPPLHRLFPFRSRAAWGADESLRFNPDGTESFPTAYFDVQTLTVHHTVTSNSDADPAATVRAVYYFQAVTEDFGDIGYHLLIDRFGTVYEGRYSGPDAQPVFGPRAVGPRPSMSNGAHVGGFNAGNVGVALLGDLTATGPTAAARRSLVAVLAALAQTTKLNPLGTTRYLNPISGATRTVPTIAGHRDWAATECPGNTFYPLLPAVRQDVADKLGY